jgi:hypothetical protein
MLDKTPTETTEVRPDSARVRRRKTRLRTVAEIDLRTVAGRRACALVKTFEQALGHDVTPAWRLKIDTAAALVAISENAQARHLRGDGSITLNDVIRAAAMARRAVRDLGINPRKPEANPLLALLADQA